ncbi:MAG: 4Fe-4S binding protein [Acidimicrobiales bacterium]
MSATMTIDTIIDTIIDMTIDARCTACGLCVVTCPETALVPAPGRPAFLASRCSDCLACIEVCPRDAITMGVGG